MPEGIPTLKCSLDHEWIMLTLVAAVPIEQANAPALALNDDAIAIVPDFVDSLGLIRNSSAASADYY